MTEEKLGNQPAYPTPAIIGDLETGASYEISCIGGLTKREEFAKAAMEGLLSNPNFINVSTKIAEEKNTDPHQVLTQCAVVHADSLLAALAALAAEADKGQTVVKADKK